MTAGKLLILLALAPLGIYLSSVAYSSIRKPTKIIDDVRAVSQWLRNRRERKALKRKYKHLDKRSNGKTK